MLRFGCAMVCFVVCVVAGEVWAIGPASRPVARRTAPSQRPTSQPILRKRRPASRPSSLHENARGCIKGRVVDAEGRPLSRVLLTTQPVSSPRWTSADGRFVICYRRILVPPAKIWRKALTPGAYTLTLFKFGHRGRTLRFVFQRRDIALGTIRLSALRGPLCVASQRSLQLRGSHRLCWSNGARRALVTRWRQGTHRWGSRVHFDEVGRKEEQMKLRNGRLHGWYSRWYANGHLACRLLFANGRLTRFGTCRERGGKVIKPPKSKSLPRLWSSLRAQRRRALLSAIANDPTLHKLRTKPWLAWITAANVRQRERRPFSVPAGAKRIALRLLAVASARRGAMLDRVWLERRDNGQCVWSMQYQKTRQIGRDPRLRIVDQGIQLPPGQYVLHYNSGAELGRVRQSLAGAMWSRRGVTLYLKGSLGYRALVK